MTGLEAIVAHRLAKNIEPKPPICFIAARQSGKNESNARAELRLLSIYSQYERELEIVKAAPTWRPQCLISKERLQRVAATPLFVLGVAAASPAFVADQLEPILGRGARAFFGVGLFAAGLTSAIVHFSKIKPENQIEADVWKVLSDLIFDRRVFAA